jgi:hypothetical protein
MVQDDQRPWETQSGTDTEKDRGHDTERGSGSRSTYDWEKSSERSRYDSDLFGDEDGGELFGDEDGGETFGGDDSGQKP